MNSIIRLFYTPLLMSALEPEEFYILKKREIHKRIQRDKPIPKGCKRFTYEDGFETIAINQKSADKKHQKYLSK